jgi:mannose-6-phosphate isomerase-like protein (cupin superfamily)
MAQPTRRVVTGKDTHGKAIVLSDEQLAAHGRPEIGIAPTLLWLTDSAPARLRMPEDLPQVGIAPPSNGTVFRIVEIPPEHTTPAGAEAHRAALKQMNLAPEGPQAANPRHPGMHRTSTVDYAVILSGEIDMLLDEADVHLKAGDVVVQQATNHAWANRGSEPCRIAFILIDAEA